MELENAHMSYEVTHSGCVIYGLHTFIKQFRINSLCPSDNIYQHKS